MIVMMTVIMLLVGVYFLVLQPAANLIRSQVEKLAVSDTRHRLLAEMLSEARDTLELRVAERTSELVAANVALEREMAERQAAEAAHARAFDRACPCVARHGLGATCHGTGP